jgi:simple sugar transport system ATP-binding protein
MRDGTISGTFDKKPLDYEGAVNAMLGRKIHLDRIVARDSANAVLTIEGLRIAQGARPFSLTLGDGEVVAITGLVGVGKTALAETLFGVRKPLSGSMTLSGKPYAPGSTGEAIAAGVFLVAKDRGENGIVGGFNIQENISLPFHKRMSRFGVLRRRIERATARRQIEELGIVCRSEKDEMAALSGGNQQKVMVARWMAQAARPLSRRAVSGRRHFSQARYRGKLRRANGRATLLSSPNSMKRWRRPIASW